MALVSFLFGENRDIFVNWAVALSLIFWFPIAKNNYPSEFAQVNSTFDVFVSILFVGVVFHFITRVFLQNRLSQRVSTILLMLSLFLLFIGVIIFIVFSAGFTTDTCDIYLSFEFFQDSQYADCWIGSFMSYLSLFLMYWFFMMLILMQIDVENTPCSKIEQLCQKNRFRLFWLIIADCCYIIFAIIYSQILTFTVELTVWFYGLTAFNGTTIILSLLFNFLIKSNINKGSSYIILYIWCIICLGIFIFGVVVYWDNQLNLWDFLAFVGESWMWSFSNVWILTEAFWPVINPENEVRYQSIAM